MAITDYLNPATLSDSISAAASSVTKQKLQETASEQNDASGFMQNFQQALDSIQSCNAGSVSNELTEENLLSESSFTSGIIDIGLGLATGNVLSAGLNSAVMLQGLINQDISKQFTELGLDVASNFLAALAGQDSATAIASATQSLESAEDTVNSSLAGLTEESATKAKEESTIDRTIHWPIQNVHELLEDDEQES